MMKLERPLLIYDGDCSFCVGWVKRWQRLTGNRIEYRSRQEAQSELSPEIDERSSRSVQLLLPDGKILEGAEAVFTLLAIGNSIRSLLWLYRYLSGFAFISETFYQIVAQNRATFSSMEKRLRNWLGKAEDFVLTRWLLLRSIALIYFVAFLSLTSQIVGLAGSHGLSPVQPLLTKLVGPLGISRYWVFPTLCWWNSSNGFLLFLTWGGTILSVLLFFGILSRWCAILLWLFYLSLVTVLGGNFLAFQWDALLLESGFLTIFLASWNWIEWRAARAPSSLLIWLYRLLIFRFILFNGLVKVLSGDHSWFDLTALDYHFFTQPLPTVLGWWSNLEPRWFHKILVVLLFVVELYLPWGIFFNRRNRLVAAGGIILLQFIILLTGNYGFFNWLTIALSFSLLDDHFLRSHLPSRFVQLISSAKVFISLRHQMVSMVVAVVILFLNFVLIFDSFGLPLPYFLQAPYQWTSSFELVNSYGAFAVMTKERPEIILEGSNDGSHWLPYEFKYKPGDLNRAPAWIAPFQPRLDWQMWFAALSAPRIPLWMERLVIALLQNEKDVTSLFKKNPFAEKSPRFIRAQLYKYRFTNLKERGKTGAWWTREFDSTLIASVTLSSQ